MDFAIPADIQTTLDQLDAFIEAEIKPLQGRDEWHSSRKTEERLRRRRSISLGIDDDDRVELDLHTSGALGSRKDN